MTMLICIRYSCRHNVPLIKHGVMDQQLDHTSFYCNYLPYIVRVAVISKITTDVTITHNHTYLHWLMTIIANLY